MISRSDSPFLKEIIHELDTKIIGRNIYHFDIIDSTNLYAKKLVKKGVDEGVVIVADVQTSGRGRKNRIWSSPKGGLWFSIILFPNISPNQGMLITMACSVAIVQGIKEITGITAEIKWPNDLLIGGKKVCGILTELDAEFDRIKYLVVGIGINVNNPLNEKLKKKATSLIKEAGKKISRAKLLRAYLIRIDDYYNKLLLGDYRFIRNSWLSYSNIIGKRVQVRDDKKVLTGKVTDVDNSGRLILETENTKIRIVSGDLKYL